MNILTKIVDIVTQILVQLHANSTAYIQIVIFIVAITFLTTVIYGPFFKAADIRRQKTKGADNVAKEAALEAKNLGLVYQNKAREINLKIKDIFDTEKTKATKHSSEVLNTAKLAAEKSTQAGRAAIQAQLAAAEKDIDRISAEIAMSLKDKFEKGV